MNLISILIWSILFPVFVYKLITFFYYLILKKDLKDANLDFFKLFLGTNCEHKQLGVGKIKYKWVKRWIVINAYFDEKGQLVKKDKSYSYLFNILTEISFGNRKGY